MARDRETPVVRLREAAAEEVRRTSLRQAAKAIGVSPSGLRNFLDGSDPYSPTWAKLERWYATCGGGPASARAIEDALRILVQELPPQDRQDATRRLLAALADAFDAAGRDAPGWVEERLRQLLGH